MTRVSHFYHLYAAGQWREPVAEHLAALEDSGFDGSFHVTLVGSPEQRAAAYDQLAALRMPDSLLTYDAGWEQVTIHALHEYAKAHRTSAIMYAHTKGAHSPVDINIRWRRAMTYHTIMGWRECLKAITNRKLDAAGCHWLTGQQFPQQVTTPFFGGNFWMASAKYLSRLPECLENDRWDAERWIGLKNPKVLDLLPGWPGTVPYTYRPMRQLVAGQSLAA